MYSQLVCLCPFLLLNVSICFKGVQKHQNCFKYYLVLDLRKRETSYSTHWTRQTLGVGSQLTTVRTAPGFCPLRAFTTCNTSTTPSVLHRSMVVAMAQNMPQRLTISLQERYLHTHTLLTLPDMTSTYLQWITMGWLSVSLWTLATSSITSVKVLRLEQRPSKAQLVMWNW